MRRLLNTKTLQLEEFNGQATPSYAVLSYRWRQDDLSFADFRDGQLQATKPGFAGIAHACDILRDEDIAYLWAHSICVDKSSTAEESEAVNAAFEWFRNASLCVVWLWDLLAEGDNEAAHTEITGSQWWSRVWTIPELIAPRRLEFYGARWNRLGEKSQLRQVIADVTGIDDCALATPDGIFEVSIGKRMSWAARREASRIEDYAYAMMGVFGVNLPIIYGEGLQSFLRLQEKILRDTRDMSLLAWESAQKEAYRGIFAQSPREFLHFSNAERWQAPWVFDGEVDCASSRGVKIRARLQRLGSGPFYLMDVGKAWESQRGGEMVAIFLRRTGNGIFVRARPGETVTEWRTFSGSFASIHAARQLDPRTERELAREGIGIDAPRQAAISTHPPPGSSTSSAPRRLAGLSRLLAEPATGRNISATHTFFGEDIGDDSGLKHPGSSTLRGQQISRWFGRHERPSTADTLVTSVGSKRKYDEDSIGTAMDAEREMEYAASHSALHDNGKEYDPNCFHSRNNGADDTISRCSASWADSEDETGSDATKGESHHAFFSVKDEIIALARSRLQVWKDTARYVVPGQQSARHLSLASSPRKRVRTTGHWNETYANADVTDDSTADDSEAVVVTRRLAYHFACPFAVREPAKYAGCLRAVELHSPAQVLQHLLKAHRRPPYCPICGNTFPTTAARDSHVRARKCESAPPVELEGVSEDQRRTIAEGWNRHRNDRSRWFAIWDAVFSGVARPATPYLIDEPGLSVSMARDFWTRRGRQLISGFLEEHQMLGYEVQGEERALAALHATILDELISGILEEHARQQLKSLSPPSRSPVASQ